MSVPYNALIIAHEQMKAFAYISVVEVILKLAVAYLLVISPLDKLWLYTLSMALVSWQFVLYILPIVNVILRSAVSYGGFDRRFAL